MHSDIRLQTPSDENIVDSLLITSGRYSVQLAKNRQQVEDALKLRFDVFNIELGEGLDESYENQMDEDLFDMQCDHILVINNANSEVIGTYRMQTNEIATKGNGFYTQSEFDIDQFPEEVINDVVELGRACIHRDHRNGRVLFLLWRGLAKYMQLLGKRYFFGCCSITSQDPNEGFLIFDHLRTNGFLEEGYMISVQPEYECSGLVDDQIKSGEVSIPQLFRLYLEQNAKVCSYPALDRKFKTIDFLILLDIQQLPEHSRALFFK